LKSFGAVIVATGGRIVRPEIPGIDSPCVCTFEDVLRCTMERCEFHCAGKAPPIRCGDTVLVWGDHFGAADAAEKLAADGKKVYVVTENREFAAWMEPCHRDVMFKRFAGGNGEGLKGKPFANPVTVIANSTLVEIRNNGEVTLMDHRFQKSSLRVDNVVLATVEPDDTIYQPLADSGVAVVKIGDAKRVRNLRAAVTEGANAGLVLDEGLRLNANSALISTA
jgi:thioredoxin reductase